MTWSPITKDQVYSIRKKRIQGTEGIEVALETFCQHILG